MADGRDRVVIAQRDMRGRAGASTCHGDSACVGWPVIEWKVPCRNGPGTAHRRGRPRWQRRRCNALRSRARALTEHSPLRSLQPSLPSPRNSACLTEGPKELGIACLNVTCVQCQNCLNVTCVQCENGKSISPIDSAQPTMAHDADTDSDLARPPDGKHPPALRLCYCGVLRAGAPPAMLWRTRVPVTWSKATVELWMGAARTTRRSRRSGQAEDRAQAGGGPEQEDRRRIRAGDVYPECWRSIH
jgi:hypothetical protein